MDWTIGVIEKQGVFAWPALETVAAAEAFIEAIAGRYGARPITASRVELALAYESPAQHNYFQSGPQVDISPGVTIHERRTFAGIVREIAATAERSEGYGEAQAAALFERLFSRRTRVEALVAPREASLPHDPAILARPAIRASLRPEVVERIVPRARAIDKSSATAESSATIPPAANVVGWGTPAAFTEPPKPVTLPAPEVKRVAEQVMHEIDRRIIARRERMGKR